MTIITLAAAASLSRWVGWRNQPRKGKVAKVPFAPRTGRMAKANDPAGWTRRDEAEAWARDHVNGEGGGIGIQLGPVDGEGYALGGVDLDSCRDSATGMIEPWAQAIIDRFGSYTEVSPSGTGVKVFLRYLTADTGALRRAMGTDHSRRFPRGGGQHPPGIELHISNRYFTVTGQHLEGTPAELRLVELSSLVWLAAEAGPAFTRSGTMRSEATEPPPAEQANSQVQAGPGLDEPSDADALLGRLHAAMGRSRKLAARWQGATDGLQDTTRSAMDMSMMALLKRARFSYQDAKALLVRWQHGAGAEHADDDRYFRRMWDRSAANGDDRPLIRITPGDLKAVVDQAEDALLGAELGLYQRGPFIVRPGAVRVAASRHCEETTLRALEVGDHALAELMTTAARWERLDGRSGAWVPANASLTLARTYKERIGHWRLPVLTGIVSAPTLRPDGSLLAVAGYDRAMGLLFAPGGTTFPEISDRPTREDALRGIAELEALVGTFPFVDGASRAVALSAILTACIRRSLQTAPMHAFTAPVAGSGKSLLVDVVSAIATGREAAVIAQGRSEEEMEKRLGALLLGGDPVVAIDNCEAPLGGDALCQMLTQPTVRVRRLGKSEAPELPSNSFVTATGNNLVLAGDLTRRALLCRLDPQCERPELRRFDADPISAAKADRGRFVVAALTILRAYHVAGRPPQRDPLGSFGEWSRWVRDALIWLGQSDPVDTMEVARGLDPQRDALAAMLAQWQAVIGPKRVSVRDIIAQATDMRPTPGAAQRGAQRPRYPDFLEALIGVAGDAGVVSSRRLSKWIAGNEGRIVNDLKIVRRGMLAGFMTWELQQAQEDGARDA